MTPSGMNSPHFKSGRYSKDIPKRLLTRLQAAENDPDLLSIRSEVALLDIRVKEMVQRLDTGESGGLWELLRKQWAELQAANAARDVEKLQACLAAVGRTIQKGARYESAWSELADAIDARTRIARAEHNRLLDLQQMITSQEALTLFSTVINVVMGIVTDESQRKEIGRQLTPLLDQKGRGPDLIINADVTAERKRKRQRKAKNKPALQAGHEWLDAPTAEEMKDCI